MSLVRIAKNPVIAKLVDSDPDIVVFVNNLLSYDVNVGGAFGWSGKSSFFTMYNRTFPAGFVYLVTEELSKAGHDVRIIQSALPKPKGPENPIVDSFGNDDPRYDYQLKALRQIEKYGAGIVRVATGGGKSKIAKLVMKRFPGVTLFLSTRAILLRQMDKQLKDIGMKTGMIGDGEMHFVSGVNLGMVQTLVQALEEPNLNNEILAVIASEHKKNKKVLTRQQAEKTARLVYERKIKRRDAISKFLSMVNVVIGEEAHEAGGNSYYKILQHCRNAKIRVALTATPFMRSDMEDNMQLMAGFGPILIDISEKMLIDRGILAKPFFKFVDSQPHPKLFKTSSYERALKYGYTENEFLINDMVRDAKHAKLHGLPVLTLVTRKKFGEILQKAYEKAGIRAVFLKGDDDSAERSEKLSALASGKIDGIIGTTILDVGVDVPAIGLVQLAGGGKAEVALRQRIGRGLRAKKSGPNVAFIADYSCNKNKYLSVHAEQRLSIIKNTPGFAEGILPKGKDFDWNIFEKSLVDA